MLGTEAVVIGETNIFICTSVIQDRSPLTHSFQPRFNGAKVVLHTVIALGHKLVGLVNFHTVQVNTHTCTLEVTGCMWVVVYHTSLSAIWLQLSSLPLQAIFPREPYCASAAFSSHCSKSLTQRPGHLAASQLGQPPPVAECQTGKGPEGRGRDQGRSVRQPPWGSPGRPGSRDRW